MSQSNIHATLLDIYNSSKEIIKITKNVNFSEYESNNILRYAVERLFIIIGEASNRLSKDFILLNDQIPWSNIIGLRHILAHHYDDILNERIWYVIENDLLKLIDFIEIKFKKDNINFTK